MLGCATTVHFQMKSPTAILGKKFYCTVCFSAFWQEKHKCVESGCLLCRQHNCTNNDDIVDFDFKCPTCGSRIRSEACWEVHLCYVKRFCSVCRLMDKREHFSPQGTHVKHCGLVYCGKSRKDRVTVFFKNC